MSLWWLLVLLTAQAVWGSGLDIDLNIATMEAPGATLSGLEASVDLSAGSFALSADRVQLGDAAAVEKLSIRCDEGRLELSPLAIDCDRARISLRHPLLILDDNAASIRWRRESGGRIVLDHVSPLGDNIVLQARPTEGGWQFVLEAPVMDVAALNALTPSPGLELSAEAALDVRLQLGDSQPSRIDVNLRYGSLAFQDTEGRFLGADLGGQLDLALHEAAGLWQGSLDGSVTKGEMLTPSAYVLAEPGHPIEFSSTVAVADAFASLRIEDFALRQRPWIDAKGRAVVGLVDGPGVVHTLEADLAPLELASFYERYLRPLLIDPLASSLVLTGRVGGGLRVKGGRVAGGALRVDAVSVADAQQTHLVVEGLNGRLEVSGRDGRGGGELSWDRARLFGFEFGAAQLPLKVEKQSLVLREPSAIGLFDGAIEIGELAIDWSTPPYAVTFDAVLTPVSMDRVSRALGWIPMQGQLSGVIPKVRLRGGSLILDGALLMRVFDGNVVIRELSVSDLFGYWPILSADAECRNLDLELLTGTYEFGRITGRIDGDIRALKLENWRPTAFDARFASSPGDGSSHRISQKAVDSIVSLSGSGMPGVLSRGFLKFFDEFRYDRLGIACRLQSGVCEMDGVEPADSGYYLVKGGGIPRIDVIGFNRFTDWDVLLERLQAVTSGGPPVIQ